MKSDGFNLIVTTQRGNERACIREFSMLVEGAEGPKIILNRTRFPGLLIGTMAGDPVDGLRKIRPRVEEDPWDFRFIQRAVPLQRSTQADIASIGEATADLVPSIPPGSSFRIVVNKRGSGLKTADIIERVASQIKRKVDLEAPDWIVQIEIVDDIAGISVLKPEDILSITKLQEESMGAQR